MKRRENKTILIRSPEVTIFCKTSSLPLPPSPSHTSYFIIVLMSHENLVYPFDIKEHNQQVTELQGYQNETYFGLVFMAHRYRHTYFIYILISLLLLSDGI